MGTKVRLGGAALAAVAALMLLASGGTAVGAKKEPPKPPQLAPSASGLVSTSDSSATTTSTTGGKTKTKTTATTSSGQGAPGAVGSTTLVLYDSTNTYGWLGELYAQYAGNLSSHFGPWHAEPVTSYQAGQIGQYTATIYIGSTYDEPLPTTFLDDVYNATRPVIWIYDNIWQLTNRYPDFATKYGWMWSQFDLSSVSHVLYNGTTLTRDGVHDQSGIMNYSTLDTSKVQVLAQAVRDSDGSTLPWAIRSGNLTYIGEIPFAYTSETDRVIAFDDMLFDALDPSAPTRHRAMVRLEDINPSQDPAELKQVVDYLVSQGIPFGFGVSPIYTDPNGYYSGGTPEQSSLADRGNGITTDIQYMQAHGGSLVMHGYTHQYSNVINPYTAVTGDDFEFYRVTENADHTLNYQGPLPGDSTSWALNRLDSSANVFKRARIQPAQIFEFPHYAGSVADYNAVAQRFSTRWERALYFGGELTGGTINYSHVIGETFPYVVHDVYGTNVLPEDLGDYAPEPFYMFPPHTVADILAAGQAELAVRDGFATFFYHPFEGVSALQQIVEGLRAQGWTFVNPAQVAQTG